MTAQCMGNFGSHKWLYPEYLLDKYEDRVLKPRNEQNETDICGYSKDTVWVNKRYIPTDLRSTAPVPRHKLMAPKALPLAEPHWVPLGEPSLRSISRAKEEAGICVSSPSTRCEEWSTLRQMLPSSGRPITFSPPNWGTGMAMPPRMVREKQTRFPHINSPMTRYTDDMHLTNRLFKLH
ncbi:uncharacterized protein LOC110983991 [Acanthaster planci]|uniref:Uncharacterized protein LOC110983991 n=1 Tax=Acanthaster planci TaxID=133434 RepID=A0A8B7Z3A7_ACAPL|nr:uncharacterized protein LOC110983991 [Acanthaster planci]